MGERYFPQEENRDLENKIYWFLILLVAGLSLLLFRAWQLQVTDGKYYLDLSENNRFRVVATRPPRGRIYDRHGSLLVNNIPSFNLYLVLEDMQDQERVIGRLAGMIKISPIKILERIKKEKRDPYIPIKIKEDLTMREVAYIEGHGLELPGVKIEAEFKRNAIGGPLAAHLLGYVGGVTSAQLLTDRYKDIKGGTIIGQYGVEQTYDSILRGSPGEKRIEVDVLGHEQQVVRETPPILGDDIFLTLDLHVQQVAEEALSDLPGAIVALDPNNGEVLAMVSHPAFNPNLMSGGVSSEVWQGLLQDKSLPLTNRAIQGQYPPGSTFKIIVSAALLETGTASPSDTIKCRGSIKFGDRNFKDWKKWGHGEVAMHRSLVESCDVYYYEMGRELGVDAISRYSHLFGLGSPTGIDLPYEKGGLIPSKEWKQKTFNEPWYSGETLSVAIGQGYVSATPLQLATMISTVAGNGVWHRPRLLKKMRNSKTDQFTAVAPEAGRQLPISHETLTLIREALAGVVSERHGTASRSRSEKVSIAGKTGTAQVVGRKLEEFEKNSENIPKELQDHAWFVAFAPLEHPEIAVAVLVENGGHGGSAAAPLAKRVIEAYFDPLESGSDRAESSKSPHDVRRPKVSEKVKVLEKAEVLGGSHG